MAIKDLEFRGINRTHLEMYFEELGGKQRTFDFPIIFIGDHWSGQILSEEEIKITSTFKVNAVYIRFQAESKEILEELVRKYRQKTTRVGG